MLSLKQLQDELKPWVLHNFGERPSWMPVLGMMEELGELAHAHLKAAENVRMEENHEAHAKDALGDIIIFLVDYCNAMGFDLESIIEETWTEVKKRDWRKEGDHV